MAQALVELCTVNTGIADYLLFFFDFPLLIDPLLSSDSPQNLKIGCHLLGGLFTAQS
jgi:hypothetical protein